MVCIAVVGLASSAEGVRTSPVVEAHCVVQVVGQSADGELLLTAPSCFRSLGEVLEAASARSTGSDAPGSHVARTQAALGLLLFTLGTHFDGLNGTGSSISVLGDSCGGGWWNTGPTWANRISSSWNGCYRLRHHDGPGATGVYADTVGAGSTHNVPSAMNNKAESVSYWGS
jgi:hypothetical protein